MNRKLLAVIAILVMLLIFPLGYNIAAAPVSMLSDCTPADGIVIQPPYSSSYVACAVGSFSGIIYAIGAIAFKQDDPNTLLVTIHAEGSVGEIYAIPLLRDADNHIIDVVIPGTSFASAPYVSTGMEYGPESVLFYSRSPVNQLGEIKPGSVVTDKIIDLTPLGVTPSVSGMNFVPPGFPNEGELKLVSRRYGEWYAATLFPDGDGTYSIETITKKSQVLYYPESFVYVPPASSPFPDYGAMLVSEYYRATVSAYLLDAESNPIPGTRSPFLTGLIYPHGTAIDPMTGDLLVVNRPGRLISVRGFGTQPWVPTPTPTATTIPPGTYTISGSVTDNYGRLLNDIYIYVDGVVTTRTSLGHYSIDGLTAGTYTISAEMWPYSFTPSQYTVTLPPDATLDFTARRPVKKVVILVHGYLGLGNITDKCEYGVKRYNQEPIPALWDDMPQWLVEDGFEVYIAHWDSAPPPHGTTPLEVSAQCLADQIADVKRITGQNQVILIAHSMGGPVSRAYLQTTRYAIRRDVEKLITLGSPHGGINGIGLVASNPLIGVGLGLWCINQPAFCQMDPGYMQLFNNRSELNTVEYTFIGGDGGGGPLGGALWLLNGPNDGLVSTASANGKYFSWLENRNALRHSLTPYQTHEDHIGDWGNWYFEARVPPNYWSESYKCVRQVLLGLNRVDCHAPPSNMQEQGSPFAFAPVQTGHISTGETISRTLTVDTADQSIFALNWMTQTLELTLVNPDGLIIDPDYALANPSVVSFDSGPAGNGLPGWMTYAFTDTVPGDWTLAVSALDAGPDGTDWTVITGFASDRTMEVGIGTRLYQIGDTATLTATLNSGTVGIAGATVNVELTRADGVIDTLTLTDMGDGHYQGTYTIPNVPGYVDVVFTANGTDGGTAFSRQSSQLLSIMPETGQLTGSYADRAVNEDADSYDDAIEVDVGIDISIAGEYNLTADLYADGQIIAQSSKLFSATAGSQTVTLRFDGRDIYNAGLDGPYLLTNLILVDLQLAVPTIMQSDLYTTAAYTYAQFMPVNIQFIPMIAR